MGTKLGRSAGHKEDAAACWRSALKHLVRPMSASPVIHPLGRLEVRARARLRAPVTAALTVTAAAVAAALTVAAADAVAAEAWALKAAASYKLCILVLDLQVGAVCVRERGKG